MRHENARTRRGREGEGARHMLAVTVAVTTMLQAEVVVMAVVAAGLPVHRACVAMALTTSDAFCDSTLLCRFLLLLLLLLLLL